MAKITITNLNTLLASVVTSNIAVQEAQSAVTNATIKAGQAAGSATAALNSKNAVDAKVLEHSGIAADIEQSVAENEALKLMIEGLESAIELKADQVTIDKAEVAMILEDVLTSQSAIEVHATEIDSMVEDFHTKYLGAIAVEPTTSWSGMELATGMIYYSIPENTLKIYTNANTWVPIIDAINSYNPAENLADVLDKAAARTNLDVYNKAETEAVVATHENRTDNPHDVTKAQVGLGQVDNTSDVNKPISIAQQAALNEKLNLTDLSQTINGDITVVGNVTVSGDFTTVNTETVTTSDNVILVNEGEVGAGVTNRYAGIEVDRGTEDNYRFVFDEVDDSFKIGKTDLQKVTTREDTPLDDGVAVWDAATNKLITVAKESLPIGIAGQAEIDRIDTTLDQHSTAIVSNTQNIIALAKSNAVGSFGATGLTLNLSGSETILPFTVTQQSTNIDKFELDTNEITIKATGNYTFLSTVVFEDNGANGAVGTVTFRVRDASTVYYTQTTTVEISGYDRDTVPFNSLLVVPSGVPITAYITASCNVSGYRIAEFSSVLASEKSAGELSSMADHVAVVPSGNLTSINVQDALEELQEDIDNMDTYLGGLITGVLI